MATNTANQNPWSPVELAKGTPASTAPGLITPGINPQPAAAAGFTPERMTVSDDQLVSGRLNKFLEAGSPVVDAARSRAQQQANSRGLINSSMAVRAGEAAAFDVALPVANAEAQAFQTAAVQNQNAGNRAQEFTAAATNQANMLNSEQFLKAKTVEADNYMKTIFATADNNLKAYMADLDANYKTLMQTDASTAAIMTQYLKAMAEVQSSANLDATGKSTAIGNLQAGIQDYLAMSDAISGLNLSALLAPSVAA